MNETAILVDWQNRSFDLSKTLREEFSWNCGKCMHRTMEQILGGKITPKMMFAYLNIHCSALLNVNQKTHVPSKTLHLQES